MAVRRLVYETIGRQHVDRAVDLALSAYESERAHVRDLPDGSAFCDLVRRRADGLFQRGCGLAALDGDHLVGFIAGYEVEEFFGTCKGVYVPLYGHAATGEDRARLYQELYTRAADMWVRAAKMTHAITFFAHDDLAIHTWFWLGFGLRCVDAIRTATSIVAQSERITLKKACVEDVPAIASVRMKHMQYYQRSPIFMLKAIDDPVQDLVAWMSEPDHHLWVAFRDTEPLGYIQIEADGESFVSTHSSVMNITGAYVVEDSRGLGVGTELLAAIQDWLSQNGYRFCGVDFESINAVGSRFWNRYFTPYAYSLVRRIDERIKRCL